MTETTPAEPEDLVVEPTATSCVRKRPYLFAILFLFFLSVGVGFWGHGWTDHVWQPSAITMASMREMTVRLDQIERHVNQLEEAIQTHKEFPLTGGMQSPETPEGFVSSAGSKSTDVDNLKADLVSLSGTLEQLQYELQRSSSDVNRNREITETGFSMILAFMKLQRQALSGHPFENERQVMRDLAQRDEKLGELLAQMERVALTGITDNGTLEREWRVISPQVVRAIRMEGVNTWYDRLRVAIEGLVSVRSLSSQGDRGASVALIEADLLRDNIAKAMEKVDSLPESAQAVLKVWKQQLHARLEVEKLIDLIASHLMSRTHEPAIKAITEPVADPAAVSPDIKDEMPNKAAQ